MPCQTHNPSCLKQATRRHITSPKSEPYWPEGYQSYVRYMTLSSPRQGEAEARRTYCAYLHILP